jgi:putative flippase GtrA
MMREGTVYLVKYIRDIYQRFTVLIHEVLKFAIVGGIGFVVQIGVTDGLHLGLGMGPVSATAIGYVISAAVTFLGNRHWAFKHRQGKGLRHETLMFVFLNAIALGIQEAVVAIVHYGMNQTGGVAFNIATLLSEVCFPRGGGRSLAGRAGQAGRHRPRRGPRRRRLDVRPQLQLQLSGLPRGSRAER